MTNTLTAVSQFTSTATNPVPVDPNPNPNPLNPQTLGHNYSPFISPFTLKSKAFFGEVYWDVLDDLRFTGGVRYTDDVKNFTVYPSTFLKSVPASLNIGTANYKAFPCASDSPLYAATQLACPFVNVGTSDAWTGKASLDWAPKLGFTDQTHVYVSLARGYKAGGFNPATLAGSPITAYAPEFIDSIEVGTKNTLFDSTVLLNLTAFHYNYLGYQIGVLTAAASLTSNINARVDGFEGEAAWQPDEHFRFNANLGLLRTGVENGPNVNQVDLANPTAGNPAWSIVKTSNGQCVVPTAQLAGVIAKQNLSATGNYSPLAIRFGVTGSASNPAWSIVKTSNGQCVVPTAQLAGVIAKQNLSATGNYSPLAIRFGVTGSASNPAGLCNSTASATYAYAVDGLNAGNVIANGLSQNLLGHQLPGAPGLTLSTGAQYSWDLTSDWNSTIRGDFYLRGAAYSRLFNAPTDKVNSFINLNLTVTLANNNDGWLVQLYGKNVLNALQITNFGLSSITFGDTTGVAALDPRMVGFSVTKSF
jgi:outer membrane receptor protein involved in Fe transport